MGQKSGIVPAFGPAIKRYELVDDPIQKVYLHGRGRGFGDGGHIHDRMMTERESCRRFKSCTSMVSSQLVAQPVDLYDRNRQLRVLYGNVLPGC